MTQKELIIKYANEISQSNDKTKATSEVLEKIYRLTYSDSETPINNRDKKYIIDEVCKIIAGKTVGKRIVLCEKENKNYLSMLKAVSSELGKLEGK